MVEEGRKSRSVCATGQPMVDGVSLYRPYRMISNTGGENRPPNGSDINQAGSGGARLNFMIRGHRLAEGHFPDAQRRFECRSPMPNFRAAAGTGPPAVHLRAAPTYLSTVHVKFADLTPDCEQGQIRPRQNWAALHNNATTCTSSEQSRAANAASRGITRPTRQLRANCSCETPISTAIDSRGRGNCPISTWCR